MVQNFSEFIVNLFVDKIPAELVVFLISLLPVLELRGGMIASSLLDVNLFRAFFICFLGNIIPIPFILLFAKKIFSFLRNKRGFRRLVSSLEERAMKKSIKVKKWEHLGLLLFVALPLPGTGGWTGALIAALLDLKFKKSLVLIIIGVLIADLIMTFFSYILPYYILG